MTERKGADEEFDALDDVILDRNAGRPRAPYWMREEMQDPRRNKQHGAGEQEGAENPVAVLGAAELDEEKRDNEELVEDLDGIGLLAERGVGPQHANEAEGPQQHRKATGRI